MARHADPKVISEPNEHGILWIYAPRRAPSAAGTVLTIGGREYPATETASMPGDQGLYAQDVTIAQIVAGTQQWRLAKSPDNLKEGAEWDLQGQSGQSRHLVVNKLSYDILQVKQIDPSDPDAAPALLDLNLYAGEYSLRSVSLNAESNTFWVFFDPGLPLPTSKSEDPADFAFQIAEDDQSTVASGKLKVQRSPGVEKVVWNFETPGSLTDDAFETTVNLLPMKDVADAQQTSATRQGCCGVETKPN